MTTKHWGDEPAETQKGRPAEGLDEGSGIVSYYHLFGGFTKLERACIDLKVPHPDLAPELRHLILESRRLDYAGQALLGLLQWSAEVGDLVTLDKHEEANVFANAAFKVANVMFAEDAAIKLKNLQPSELEKK